MKLIVSLLAPLAVGAGAGFFTQEGVHSWYVHAAKPSFNPPNWVFFPVWTLLYIMMGIACYLVWKSATGGALKRKALITYVVQLAFNFAWSFLFFAAQRPDIAFAEIIILLVLILLTIFYFSKISKTAAWLLVPYLCWIAFASVLNFCIWRLN